MYSSLANDKKSKLELNNAQLNYLQMLNSSKIQQQQQQLLQQQLLLQNRLNSKINLFDNNSLGQLNNLKNLQQQQQQQQQKSYLNQTILNKVNSPKQKDNEDELRTLLYNLKSSTNLNEKELLSLVYKMQKQKLLQQQNYIDENSYQNGDQFVSADQQQQYYNLNKQQQLLNMNSTFNMAQTLILAQQQQQQIDSAANNNLSFKHNMPLDFNNNNNSNNNGFSLNRTNYTPKLNDLEEAKQMNKSAILQQLFNRDLQMNQSQNQIESLKLLLHKNSNNDYQLNHESSNKSLTSSKSNHVLIQKNLVEISSEGCIKNIPPNMLLDQYGMLGLIMMLRHNENTNDKIDKNISIILGKGDAAQSIVKQTPVTLFKRSKNDDQDAMNKMMMNDQHQLRFKNDSSDSLFTDVKNQYETEENDYSKEEKLNESNKPLPSLLKPLSQANGSEEAFINDYVFKQMGNRSIKERLMDKNYLLLNHCSEDLLFYLYYSCCSHDLQQKAYDGLCKRNWFYSKDLSCWFKPVLPQLSSEICAIQLENTVAQLNKQPKLCEVTTSNENKLDQKGQFFYFDLNQWKVKLISFHWD